MARIARVVVPNYPHHITQRGNRRQQTFFSDSDYRSYIELLTRFKLNYEVDIWAYCLMPNHAHIVAVPHDTDGLAKCLSRTHRNYALLINQRNHWQGHLWQERFRSFVMDEAHLVAAVRYIELNPVRAGICHRPEEWKWSSVRAHLECRSNLLVDVQPMLDRISDWSSYLCQDENPELMKSIHAHSKTERPAGNEDFMRRMESLTGKHLRKDKPGPKI